MYDIIVSNKNEKEFIEIAKKLGISLLFIGKEVAIAKDNDIKKAKKLSNLVLCKPKNARNVIEKQKPDCIFGLEEQQKKDSLHHRNTGLNQVLCKLMQKNNIAYLFYPTNNNIIQGRMQQNIKLCRKYKIKTIISSLAEKPYNLKSSKDLESLFITLGMTPTEAKQSMLNVVEIINKNKHKKSSKYIEEGVEII